MKTSGIFVRKNIKNMKKITLLAGLLLSAVVVNAQDYYTFSQSTATYTDLTGATSMNNGQVWQEPEYGPFVSSFAIDIFGVDYLDFGFAEYQFIFANDDATDDPFVMFFPISVLPVDRNFSGVGVSQSPISYKTDGTAGNRILKLELKNAGLESEMQTSAISTLYCNYQIWFYEADKSIEFHIGPNNITNKNQLNEVGISSSGFLYESDTDYRLGYIDGTVANPMYVETININDEPTDLNAIIPTNTVYRFAVNPLSVKDQEKVVFTMFPNPANDVLNLTFSDAVNKPYSVYDLMGREVLKGTLNNTNEAQINVGTLQKGSYVLRVAGSTQKFVKN